MITQKFGILRIDSFQIYSERESNMCSHDLYLEDIKKCFSAILPLDSGSQKSQESKVWHQYLPSKIPSCPHWVSQFVPSSVLPKSKLKKRKKSGRKNFSAKFYFLPGLALRSCVLLIGSRETPFIWQKKSVDLIPERHHMCFRHYWPLQNLPSLTILP